MKRPGLPVARHRRSAKRPRLSCISAGGSDGDTAATLAAGPRGGAANASKAAVKGALGIDPGRALTPRGGGVGGCGGATEAAMNSNTTPISSTAASASLSAATATAHAVNAATGVAAPCEDDPIAQLSSKTCEQVVGWKGATFLQAFYRLVEMLPARSRGRPSNAVLRARRNVERLSHTLEREMAILRYGGDVDGDAYEHANAVEDVDDEADGEQDSDADADAGAEENRRRKSGATPTGEGVGSANDNGDSNDEANVNLDDCDETPCDDVPHKRGDAKQRLGCKAPSTSAAADHPVPNRGEEGGTHSDIKRARKAPAHSDFRQPALSKRDGECDSDGHEGGTGSGAGRKDGRSGATTTANTSTTAAAADDDEDGDDNRNGKGGGNDNGKDDGAGGIDGDPEDNNFSLYHGTGASVRASVRLPAAEGGQAGGGASRPRNACGTPEAAAQGRAKDSIEEEKSMAVLRAKLADAERRVDTLQATLEASRGREASARAEVGELKIRTAELEVRGRAAKLERSGREALVAEKEEATRSFLRRIGELEGRLEEAAARGRRIAEGKMAEEGGVESGEIWFAVDRVQALERAVEKRDEEMRVMRGKVEEQAGSLRQLLRMNRELQARVERQ